VPASNRNRPPASGDDRPNEAASKREGGAPRPDDVARNGGAAERAERGADVVDGPTRITIVDDHLAFAEPLAVVINASPDLRCVGIAASLADGLDLMDRTQPDIVLLDVRLPDGDGTGAIPEFRARAPMAKVLVLTGHLEPDVFARAASAGAAGFLRKEGPVSGILRSIRAARQGEVLVEQTTLAAILTQLRAEPTPVAPNTAQLTSRELEVLALMGQGLDPHAIAERLQIRLSTCRGYEKNIMAKLDAHSQLEAVVVATRRGLIPTPRD
jgi:DNA-binding NarL/FixJ family response regulator